MVHDSTSLAPLSGVALFLVDDATGAVVSPGELEAPAQQGQVTGADGKYRFLLTSARVVRLRLDREDARFVFPSVLARPVGGTAAAPFGDTACAPVTCPGGQLSPLDRPSGSGRYALRFAPLAGGSAQNNHVPVDSLGALIRLEKRADRQVARLGDLVVYTLDVTSAAPDPITDAALTDVLPLSLVYVTGSARAFRVDTATTPIELPLRVEAHVLRFDPVTLAPGARLRVRYVARVASTTPGVKIVNLARVERPGGILVSNEARAILRVEGEPWFEQSTIFGSVFCDGEGAGKTGWRDGGEEGLYGARVYLETGFTAAADPDGLFHFTGVPAGMHLVKLDEGSLPPGSALIGSPLRQLHLTPGVPAKVSFPVRCALEKWSTPAEIHAVAHPAEVKPKVLPPSRSVGVEVDLSRGLLKIADHQARFMTPSISAEKTQGGLRVWPRYEGDLNPTRWRIEIDALDAAGQVLTRALPEIGIGLPPLSFEAKIAAPPDGWLRAALIVEAGAYDRAVSAPALIPVRPRQQEAGEIDGASALGFEMGEDAAAIDEAVRVIDAARAESPSRRVVILGHSDDEGGEAAARERGLTLARRVRDLLVDRGVPAGALAIATRGAEAPIAPNTSPRFRAQNRRIELLLEGPRRPVVELPAAFAPPPPRVVVALEGQQAEIPVAPDGRAVAVIDVDVPATVAFEIDDGRGIKRWIARAVTAKVVVRPDEREPVIPGIEKGELQVGPAAWPLPVRLPSIASIRVAAAPAGASVSIAVRDADDVQAWKLELLDAQGRVAARAAGEDPPPSAVSLTASATTAAAGGLSAVLTADARAGHRVIGAKVPVPRLLALPPEVELDGRAARDPSVALEPIALSMQDRPGARLSIAASGGKPAERDDALARVRQALVDLGVSAEAISDDTAERPGGGRLRISVRVTDRAESPIPAPVLDARLAAKEGPIEVSGRVLTVGRLPGPILLVPFPEMMMLGPAWTGDQPDPADASALPPPIDASKIPAAQVEALVPAAASELPRLFLPIRGQTLPTNQLAIDGLPVRVDASGRFAHTVPLTPGKNKVTLTSKDPEGNEVQFVREVTTSSSAWFLMAMGDAAVGKRGAELAGMNSATLRALDAIYLHGRIAAFGEARFTLPALFRRVSVVGLLDTARLDEPSILRMDDDPLRGLPAFGDTSVEEQRATARHKLYAEIVADESRVRVGSGETSLSTFGTESLFSYRRAGHGVHAKLAKHFEGGHAVAVEGVVTFEDARERRARDELQGTGGSMYWLSHEEIVEGSERVTIVVRDRDTGLVLETVPKERYRDYEVRPREGRVTLMSPLPSVAGEARALLNRSVGPSGNPVYLVVEYSYLAEDADEQAAAVSGRAVLWDQLEVSGGVANETAGARGKYTLAGGGIAWRPKKDSFLEAELAASQNDDASARLSTDGGLHFASIVRPGSEDGTSGGAAVSVTGQLTYADLGASRGGLARAYVRYASDQFWSATAARSTGKLQLGAFASLELGAGFWARAAIDTASAELGDVTASNRMITGAVEHLGESHRATVEVTSLRRDLGSQAEDGTAIAAAFELSPVERLTLRLAQDFLLGDVADGAGIAATTFGASYALHTRVVFSAAETIRWNGENTTQLGARLTAADGLDLYVAERFRGAGRLPGTTTVIGAEDATVPGSRTYGEYQIDGGASAGQARLVLGMDNRWPIADGLSLLLAYERAQVTEDAFLRRGGALPADASAYGGLSYTLGFFAADAPLAQGAVSRDALSVGLLYRPNDKLELSTRAELRVDQGDLRAGGRDILVIGTHEGLVWRALRDVTVLSRLTVQHAEDLDLERTEAKLLEWSIGAIFRPRDEDWLTVPLRYTKRIVQRPSYEDRDGLRMEETRDALSIEPILDTPFGFQLAEKVALIHAKTRQDGAAEVDGLSVLWINRAGVPVIEIFEAAVEYRLLGDLLTEQLQHGFLFEAAWIPDPHVRVGAGYNFTSFGDDAVDPTRFDASGPFLRVTARY